jgi:hypothetical protein
MRLRPIATALCLGIMPFVVSAEDALPLTTQKAPTVQPTTAPASPWPKLSEMLGLKGEERGDVYTVTVPRTDLDVSTVDIGPIPTAAGLESQFHFFMCPCGKTNVVGTFVVAEYESNDVIDSLRAARFHVLSIGAALYNEEPRILTLRFQGEGQAQDVANAIKDALNQTGEARNPRINLPK